MVDQDIKKQNIQFITCPTCSGLGKNKHGFDCAGCRGMGIGAFYQGQFLVSGPTFDLGFPLQRPGPVKMTFIMDHAYRRPSMSVSGGFLGVVLIYPALDIRSDPGIERSVRALDQIYIPHLVSPSVARPGRIELPQLASEASALSI